MNYGFIKACAVSPALRVADCPYNAQKTIEAMQQAAEDGCQLTVFPELGLTGYTCGDLFLQQPLLDAAEAALREILKASEALQLVALVGLPVTVDAKLYNCAAVICQGALLGLVPKSHIPNYGEFYEKRHYCAAPAGVKEISFAGQKTLFGTKLLFRCETMQAFTLAVEICEDLWAPLPPSTAHALAGATVLANLSASDETVGKAEYRRALVSQQSARLLCAYLYADAGHGESTTDMVFSGHNLIAENGALLAESRPFSQALACTELDLGRLLAERRRNTSFEPVTDGYETVSFHLPLREIPLTRYISPTPFVPADGGARAERCELILQMQADGLAKRIEHAHAKTAVIGISGGLDSCLALLVAVHAMKKLDRSMDSILAVTMPCFGTTKRTKSSAVTLTECIGAQLRDIDIVPACTQHMRDIGHDMSILDVTYENVQARERTQILMDTANKEGALLVGTGDLSELALGWCTYNADHMSMYGVNCSVPKTLVRYLVDFVADERGGKLGEVLREILATPVSPELLPPDKNGKIAQKTEDTLGPYEVHDFFLYHFQRFGASPDKLMFMACRAFGGVYSREQIEKWLRLFMKRFFSQQFKRSCIPDGPKVGSVSLSPRGDWRMPSDADSSAWLDL